MIKNVIPIISVLAVLIPNIVFADDNTFIENDLDKAIISDSELISTKMLNELIGEKIATKNGITIKLIKITDLNPDLPRELDNILINKVLDRNLNRDSEFLLHKYDQELGSINEVKPQFIPAFILGAFVGGLIYSAISPAEGADNNNITIIIGEMHDNSTFNMSDVNKKITYMNLSKNTTISPSLSYIGPNIQLTNNSINSLESMPPSYNLSDGNVTSSLESQIFSP